MCGSEGQMFKAEIEGSELTVCKQCSRYGKEVEEIRQLRKEPKKEEIISRSEGPKKEIMFLILDDYASIIKAKREKLQIKQEDFAKDINEKLSLIHQIETGKFKPSIELARKLEKALKITLIEQHEEIHKKPGESSNEEFTIGDFLKLKKK